MPDKHGEPTSEELQTTGLRILSHSVAQARAVVDRLRDDPEVKKRVEHFRQTQKDFANMENDAPAKDPTGW